MLTPARLYILRYLSKTMFLECIKIINLNTIYNS